ncbi:MAG TPA: hypothetical protein VK894_11340 [Jiangellales bacterium]|nr:hypothetical protein [Jiangellales bacterium]
MSETTRDVAGWPRLVAGTVVSLDAAALLGFALWEVYRSTVETPSSEAVAQGTMAYFGLLGTVVAVLAVAVWRLRSWSHGAAVFLQLLALPVAWTMAGGGFWWGAVLLGGSAVAALVALLSPAGRAAYGR